MDVIRRFDKPNLRRPQAVVAFEGWNDACDAASGAVNYLIGQLDAGDPFAIIEPEEFFDFQAHRPRMVIDDGGTRSLTWPSTKFYAAQLPDRERDLVIVLGEEPSHRWKTFTRSITRLLAETDVEEAVVLGAFIGRVAHTTRVPIVGVATDPDLVAEHGLLTSSYEGPTGISGVLQEACRKAGLRATSLWAATPHYLAANPNPKAMLALLGRAATVLGFEVDTAELEKVVEEFIDRVDAAVRSSEEFTRYIARLENEDVNDPSALDPSLSNELVSEIEEFLRQH